MGGNSPIPICSPKLKVRDYVSKPLCDKCVMEKRRDRDDLFKIQKKKKVFGLKPKREQQRWSAYTFPKACAYKNKIAASQDARVRGTK